MLVSLLQLHHDRAVTAYYIDKLLMRKAGARLLTCLHAKVCKARFADF